jgi:apolipoprotein N-acyltransferase
VRRFWPEVAAATSGLLLALCYPPFDLGGLVWIWVAPLLAALWFSEPRPGKKGARPRWRHGFRLGFVAGFVFVSINASWVVEMWRVAGTIWAGIGGLVAMSAYLALYFAAFGAFAATVGRWKPDDRPARGTSRKRDLFTDSLSVLRVAFLNGAAWCGLEWLRGVVIPGFGWNGLGVALKEHLTLVQFADVIGVNGYGFVLMFAGTVLFCTFVRVWHEVRSRRRLRPHFDLGIASAMVAGLFLYGLSAMMRQPDKTIDLRARVMQMNIDLEDKWSEDLAVRQKVIYDYRDLTRTFVETAPHDLVVWPETALPGVFNFPWVQEYLNDHILKGEEFYLIAGLEDSNLQNTEIYNTITIMKGDTGSHQMHRKSHLMPFGEYIPFRKTFPLFAWIAGGVIVQDFTAGDSIEPLSVEKEGHSIGIIPLICIEDTIPFHARAFVRPGPQILVNVTNDGWFYDSVQPQQHFNNAIFRCIELRRPMIRAANTGVSGFIDERGSVYDRSGREKNERIVRDLESGSTYIRGSVPATLAIDLDPPITVFARIGDSFSIAVGLIALGFAFVPWARKRVKLAA